MVGLQIRGKALRFVALGYFVLLTLILIYFDNDTFLPSILFLLINFYIAIAFFNIERSGSDKLLFYLIYSVYSLGYVFKAIVLNAADRNSHYVYNTIKVVINPNDYVDALNVVTIGHILLVCLLFVASILHHRRFTDLTIKGYISNNTINIILLFIFIWISLSSVIMFSYGVALMGAESVSLPYKLSGIFFYSRTLIIPILLLYFLEKSMVRGDRPLFNKSVMIYFFLAASEVLVRASKGPLLQIVLLVVVLSYQLLMRGVDTRRFISKKHLFVVFVVAIAAFPLITIYRSVVVGVDFETAQFALVISDLMDASSTNGSSYLTEAIVHFFHRLVGFTQMAGILAMKHTTVNFVDFFEYGSIAKYYTKGILGHHMANHSSSPSLIGAALFLGGKAWWPVVFLSYLSFMIVVWRYSSRIVNLEVVVKCQLAYEVFNTIIAGTIDSSFYRITIMLIFVLIFEATLGVARVASIGSNHTVNRYFMLDIK